MVALAQGIFFHPSVDKSEMSFLPTLWFYRCALCNCAFGLNTENVGLETLNYFFKT